MSTSEVFVLKMQKEGKCGFFWYLLTTLLGWAKRKPHAVGIEGKV